MANIAKILVQSAQLKMQPYQGGSHDDSGVNAVKLGCTNGKSIIGWVGCGGLPSEQQFRTQICTYIVLNADFYRRQGHLGNWAAGDSCRQDYYITGIRIRNEREIMRTIIRW